jgi:hypothetical protein
MGYIFFVGSLQLCFSIVHKLLKLWLVLFPFTGMFLLFHFLLLTYLSSLSLLNPCTRCLCLLFLLRICQRPSVTDQRCNTQLTSQIASNRLAFWPNASVNVLLFSLTSVSTANSFVTTRSGEICANSNCFLFIIIYFTWSHIKLSVPCHCRLFQSTRNHFIHLYKTIQMPYILKSPGLLLYL